MKKLNAFVMALFMSLAVAAQDAPKYGLKGGLNLSTLNYSNNTDADWRTGFHIGALSHIHLSPSFSLQPEVYYSIQGAKIPYGNGQMNLNLSYVNIPVLLQYNFANGFRLQGGPQLGILAGVSDKVNDVELNALSTDNFNSIDFSVPLGLSYLGYSGLGVDARYNIGVSNVYEANTVKAKNHVFQVGVFYLFDHKHKAKSR